MALYVVERFGRQIVVAEGHDSLRAVVGEVDKDVVVGTALQRLATSKRKILAKKNFDESIIVGQLFGIIPWYSFVNLFIE